MFTPICETSQIYDLMERRPMKDVLSNHLKDRLLHLVHWLSITLQPANDQARIHQFGKKVLLGLFFGYAVYARRNEKGEILVADIEELETMDASEIYSKRLNAKEVIFPKKKENLFLQSQMDESKPLEEIRT